MSNRWLAAALQICFFGVATIAQQPAPSPPPPAPTNTPQPTSPPRYPQMGVRPPIFEPLNRIGNSSTANDPDPMLERQMVVQQYAAPLYRKPTAKELKMLAPEPLAEAKYADFLRAKNTGIFRLVPDMGCAVNAKILNASERCLQYTMPGAGNSFSFRSRSHRLRALADITLSNGTFLMTGVLTQGMMTDLGSVAIESVGPDWPEYRLLAAFEPETDYQRAAEIDRELVSGIVRDGVSFRRNLPVAAGHVYLMRAVAYRGRVMKAVHGAEFNELDFDRRRDVIVAFKVVDLAPDGAVTIVWKKLRDTEAPAIKIPKSAQDDGRR